ncbi:unnamed protein product, partial [Protopolystoma xenopodis]
RAEARHHSFSSHAHPQFIPPKYLHPHCNAHKRYPVFSKAAPFWSRWGRCPSSKEPASRPVILLANFYHLEPNKCPSSGSCTVGFDKPNERIENDDVIRKAYTTFQEAGKPYFISEPIDLTSDKQSVFLSLPPYS